MRRKPPLRGGFFCALARFVVVRFNSALVVVRCIDLLEIDIAKLLYDCVLARVLMWIAFAQAEYSVHA